MKAEPQLKQMTLEEFAYEFNQEPFELINGEKIALSPSVAGPNFVAKLIFRALMPFEEQGLGEAFTEAAFVHTEKANWVKGSRVPNVMFFRAARLAAYRSQTPDWREKPYVLVPDFVVEVVSPTDSYSDVNAKIDAYLSDGVRLIWVVDPQRNCVTVYYQGKIVIIGEDAILKAMM